MTALTPPRPGTGHRPDVVTASPGGLAPGHRDPVLVAHRGASGYRPEHTLAAYELAARMGADYLGVDLVPTRDRVLVARHDGELSATTDIADRPEHRGRRTVREVQGWLVRGWFVEHLTLEQVRELRATERFPHLRHGSVGYNGLLGVPTLAEVLALRARMAGALQRPLGLALCLRTPGHFAELGLDPVTALVEALDAAGLCGPDAPVVVLSEDWAALRQVRASGPLVPLQLQVAVGEHRERLRRLDRVAGLVGGLSVDKHLVLPRRFDGTLGEATGLLPAAHAAGLGVHTWTFRAENTFLPTDLRRGEDDSRPGRAAQELSAFLDLGVDGVCTDHTDRGVLARG